MSISMHPRDLPNLDDAALPVESLLGSGTADLLDAVVGSAGGSVHKATPRQATYVPGSTLTVSYDVSIGWPDRPVTNELIVATAGGRLPSRALKLQDGTHEIGAWRMANDPRLPGLAAVLDADRLRTLLAALGADVDQPRIAIKAYRPGRRAVVEVTAPGLRLFIKVVRPHRVEALDQAHRRLEGVAPVPRTLGWSAEHGLVVLQALAGRTLREDLRGDRPLPGPAAHIALLDMLPDPRRVESAAGDVATVDSAWSVGRFVDLISATNPELAGRLARLSDDLAAGAERRAAEPLAPVHGDYHEAQVLVDGGAITGLLDVDTFGLGRRVDDYATMIGHLSTLALGSPRRARIERHAAHLLAAFDRSVDPVLLRHAVAAVVVGMATGPFRVLEPHWRRRTADRVALAERWVQSAQSVARQRSVGPDENSLTSVSGTRQVPVAS